MTEFLGSTSDNVSDLVLQSGDKVCYVSMVSSYNRTVGENTFRYSNSKCVFVSKKPKVQIWGGDARTNKEAITSITVQKNTRLETEHVIDASVLQSSGLWKTGIDNNNNTLKDDSKDPHWSIICSQDYKGGSGNQKAYNQSNNPAWLPACKGDASGLKNVCMVCRRRMATCTRPVGPVVLNRPGASCLARLPKYRSGKALETGREIGRASCRERV